MRQADSTIKGFLYQFDKSLYEILIADDKKAITLEGQIEDIDISSPSGVETIQCKYHEDQDYSISSVAEPILEMLCHYITHRIIGGNVKYVLYAYFKNNVSAVDTKLFEDFLINTTNQDILVKFFPQIYHISDNKILSLSNKLKKSKDDKQLIKKYFTSKKGTLSCKINLQDFFDCFEYRKAEKHEDLKNKIIQELCKNVDPTTAKDLYYPNAFSRIAELSSLPNPILRQITRPTLYKWLENQKSLLITKWLFEIRDKKNVLKEKKLYLSTMFSGNPDVRAFIFTNTFLEDNESELSNFFIEYINKYFCKKKLQKPPLFILDCPDIRLLNVLVMNLYKYQLTVNTGLVVSEFLEESFVNNINCPSDFSAKMTVQSNFNIEILHKCKVNHLFYVGCSDEVLTDSCFRTEILGIQDISELRYLVGLDKTFKEESK